MGSHGSKTRKPSEEELDVLLRTTSFDKETICAWYRAFTRHSGGSNVMEVKEMMRISSYYCGRHVLRDGRLASMFSEGEGGKVSFTEFLTVHYLTTQGPQRDRLLWLFRLCDADKDGYISGEDLMETMSTCFENNRNTDQIRELIFRCNKTMSEDQFIKQCELLISNQAFVLL